MKIIVALFLTLFFVLPLSYAKEAQLNEDPEIKDRFKHLTSELRCLKCQNQTIWDSKAGLADDLRKQIRTQIYAGKSDDEIVQYMVDRYGEFVRYSPSITVKNVLLWVGPFLFMALGGFMLIRYIKIRKAEASVEEDVLSEEDRNRAQEILKDNKDN